MVNIMFLLFVPSLIIGAALQIGLMVSPPDPSVWPIEDSKTAEYLAESQQSPVDS
ncbi:MAG: hypothetical protein ACI87C_002114 [Paraperlucidibaca sp.]|jgi:hypothetical protein|tara:strand:- start:2971 stop:3135 length:165 start_codon:yes stop_codon:yes gene_type:complete